MRRLDGGITRRFAVRGDGALVDVVPVRAFPGPWWPLPPVSATPSAVGTVSRRVTRRHGFRALAVVDDRPASVGGGGV